MRFLFAMAPYFFGVLLLPAGLLARERNGHRAAWHKAGAILLLLIGAGWIGHSLRALTPYPTDYVTRLTVLDGWTSVGQYALPCSGFISNAHGESLITEQEFYRAEDTRFKALMELASRWEIDETTLKPGDIAAFGGPAGDGIHVAAFLGRGTWVDGDARRGYVAFYRLQDKPEDDTWFTGRVRILRWVTPPPNRGLAESMHFFDEAQMKYRVGE